MFDKYAKAIVGALGVAYGLYVAATGADSAGGVTVTTNEWVGIAVTTILTTAAIWAVPNKAQPVVYPPAPDSVTTVNVDRGPPPTTATTDVRTRPGSEGRIVNGDHLSGDYHP